MHALRRSRNNTPITGPASILASYESLCDNIRKTLLSGSDGNPADTGLECNLDNLLIVHVSILVLDYTQKKRLLETADTYG